MILEIVLRFVGNGIRQGRLEYLDPTTEYYRYHKTQNHRKCSGHGFQGRIQGENVVGDYFNGLGLE